MHRIQYILVAEPVMAQAIQHPGRYLVHVCGHGMGEVEQGACGVVEGRGAIVLLDGAGEAGVVGCGTQILCVSLRSVVAPLGLGGDDSNRLALAASETGGGMHQLRVQADGGAHGAGPQALEANDVEDASGALNGGVVLILEDARGVLVGTVLIQGMLLLLRPGGGSVADDVAAGVSDEWALAHVQEH